jgi:hypothetical protein
MATAGDGVERPAERDGDGQTGQYERRNRGDNSVVAPTERAHNPESVLIEGALIEQHDG